MQLRKEAFLFSMNYVVQVLPWQDLVKVPSPEILDHACKQPTGLSPATWHSI